MDGFELSHVLFADDVILVSETKEGLEKMIEEAMAEFRKVGLEVGCEKTRWSSWPPTGLLQVGQDTVPWSPCLTFIGGVIDLGGNSGAAMSYRMAQADKAWAKWKPLLTCKWAPVRRRADLAVRAVFSSLLWLAATWTPTGAQQKHLESWAARMMARTVGLRRALSEDMGGWWRRMHREGHLWLRMVGGGPCLRRRVLLHRFAGHLARAVDGVARMALRTRNLAWWRQAQESHKSKHNGVHPARFKTWRWESQLTSFYGETKGQHLNENYGWMALAQQRQLWKVKEESFAVKH